MSKSAASNPHGFYTWINLLKFLPLRLEFHKQFMNWEVRMPTDPVPTETLLGKIS